MKRQCLWLMLKTSLLPYHIEVIKASKSKKKQEEEEEATAPQYPIPVRLISTNNQILILPYYQSVLNNGIIHMDLSFADEINNGGSETDIIIKINEEKVSTNVRKFGSLVQRQKVWRCA